MNIYHKLKVSYIIRHVIIKHALVKELLILEMQNDDINLDKKALLSTNHSLIVVEYLIRYEGMRAYCFKHWFWHIQLVLE